MYGCAHGLATWFTFGTVNMSHMADDQYRQVYSTGDRERTSTTEEGRNYIDPDRVVKIYIGSTNCTEARWYFLNDRKNMKIEKFLQYNKKFEKSRK